MKEKEVERSTTSVQRGGSPLGTQQDTQRCLEPVASLRFSMQSPQKSRLSLLNPALIISFSLLVWVELCLSPLLPTKNLDF